MNADEQPDPDALLAELQASQDSSGEGHLKIFLGMCPGVGKTYSMLLAGQTKQEEGLSVRLGVLETHGRVETLAVSAGIARVPLRQFTHRNVTMEEMDIDAILVQKPDLVLVDELAHSNAVGSRHPKRWQDVFELLKAGIDVYTTLNVQHIESYRDLVRQITGAPVNETVPDSVLDRADEVELIDITSEELRKRLSEGKVYSPDRAKSAADNFFKEGNLKALREIALRITADKADQDMRRFRSSRRIKSSWHSGERFLVAVSGSPFSERLIRIARRAAASVHAPWIAVYVDTGRELGPVESARLESNLHLARSLGAEIIMTTGRNVVEALLRIGRENHVSQIVVGKSLEHPLVEWLRGGSLVSKLIRSSESMGVYVVRADKASGIRWRPLFDATRAPSFWREIGIGFSVVAVTTIIGLLLLPLLGYSSVGLLYLLAVLFCAGRLSRAPIFLTAALTAFAWDFLFIPPTFTFFIQGAHDIILFTMYFVVALVIGQLHSHLRQREKVERRREQQAVAYNQFSRALTESPDLPSTLDSVSARLGNIFAAEVFISLLDDQGKLTHRLPPQEAAVAAWASEHREAAGRFTNTLPQSQGLHIPLLSSTHALGVLSIYPREGGPIGLAEKQMLETFAAQIAVAVEQFRLQAETESLRIEEKSRELQKTLLDSVSHELKTPLAVVSVAADRLRHTDEGKTALLDEIDTALVRLDRVLGNLLDVTRIETGSIRPHLVWCDLHEIVSAARERVQNDLGPRSLHYSLPEDAVKTDAGLLEEILVNVLRNAAQHSPPTSSIDLQATLRGQELLLTIRDEGPGIDVKDASRLFEKFFRGQGAIPGGLGLGLSIVRGFVQALGGTVEAQSRTDGKSGTEFRILLPITSRDIRAVPSDEPSSDH